MMGAVVARNSVVTLAGQLGIKLLSFVFSVLVVRHLGATEYGQYAWVLAFGGLFATLSDPGLGPYTVRAVARERERAAELLALVLPLRLLLALATAGLILAVALATGVRGELVLGLTIGGAGLVGYGLLGPFDAVLQGRERLDWSALCALLNQLTFVLLGLAVLLLGLGFLGLIAASVVGVGLAAAVAGWGLRRQIGPLRLRLDPRAWPPLLRAALPFGVGGVALMVWYRVDAVLLGIYAGDQAVGWYGAAYALIFSAMVVSHSLNTALYPTLARTYSGAPRQLQATTERATLILLLCSLPLAVGGTLLAPEIVHFLYDAEFAPAAPALQVLLWVLPLMFVSELLGYVLLVRGQEAVTARVAVVNATFNVGLNLLLIPRFGIPAAAAVTVLTELLCIAQYLLVLRAQFTLPRDLLLALPRLSVALLAMAAAVLLGQRAGLHLLALVALGGPVYAAALLPLGLVASTDLARLAAALARWRHPGAEATAAE